MLVPCNLHSCYQLQVLVIYLGDMRWKWLPLAGLLPFQKHRQEKVAEAESLVAAKRLTKPILFHKALKVGPKGQISHLGKFQFTFLFSRS